VRLVRVDSAQLDGGDVDNVTRGPLPLWAMAARADIFMPLEEGFGLLRMVGEVESFERKNGDKSEQWIHILPAGPVVVARDGRTFQITDVLKVVADTELPLLIDWEHQSEWGQTRAAGWVESLEIESGKGGFPQPGVWGRAVWTEEGTTDVQKRAYRFLSPTIRIDNETRDVVKVLAVALTNRPALSMQGLDSFRESMTARFGHQALGDHAMTPETKKALCSVLSLGVDASDSSILEAARKNGTEVPRLNEMCSRLTNDLAAANTRAQTAEQKLTEQGRSIFEASVERVLENASKEGKVTPAQAKSWREFCLTDERSFAQFRDQVLPTLPTIGDKAPPSPPSDETPPRSTSKSAFGYGADQIKKAKDYLAEQRARVLADGDDDGED